MSEPAYLRRVRRWARAERATMNNYDDPRWQRKRLECMQRDDWTCVACDDKQSQLHVHHIQYCGDLWSSPLNDLQTLCHKCHGDLGKHPKGGVYWDRFGEHRVFRVLHCPLCGRDDKLTDVAWESIGCTGCNWKSNGDFNVARHGAAVLPPVAKLDGTPIRRVYLAGKMGSRWRDGIINTQIRHPHSEAHWHESNSGIHEAFGPDELNGAKWPVSAAVIDIPFYRTADYVGPYWNPAPAGYHTNASAIAEEWPNTHASAWGADADEAVPESDCNLGFPIVPAVNIVIKCQEAISTCDLFFAWIDTPDAFGTFVEIGFASASSCKVVVALQDSLNVRDMWFVMSNASYGMVSSDALTAWRTFWESRA